MAVSALVRYVEGSCAWRTRHIACRALYGLGAGGKQGVTKALEIIHKELDMTMALCGHRDIRNITRDILRDCPF